MSTSPLPTHVRYVCDLCRGVTRMPIGDGQPTGWTRVERADLRREALWFCDRCLTGCDGVPPVLATRGAFRHPEVTYQCAGCLRTVRIFATWARLRLPAGWRAVTRPDGPPRALCGACQDEITTKERKP